MSRAWSTLVVLFLVAADQTSAQDPSLSQVGRGTTVTAGEITAAVRNADTGAVADAMLRVLPIAGEYNVGGIGGAALTGTRAYSSGGNRTRSDYRGVPYRRGSRYSDDGWYGR
jgi:hypothetical protein